MSSLEVRSYNVGFGDAVLVSIPEFDRGREVVRHILIDVGNLLAGEGNADDVFDPVVADIAAITGGEVDLYVMTHEHLDHVQGLLAAKERGVDLTAKHSWLTASASPDYYDRFPAAKKKRLGDAEALLDLAAQHHQASDPWLELMILNNSPFLRSDVRGLRTADYVDHLRSIAPEDSTHYVDRETPLAGTHPFVETKLRVLAPEADTSTYYGRRRIPLALTDGETASGDAAGEQTVVPPVGVDAGAYFDLVASRSQLNRRSILEIDAAANNTSIVLEIEWRGWRLLFGGDAEERSWQTMEEQGLLRPVHFVKIAHHGSVNGTDPHVLDTVLPQQPHDSRGRFALVSTHDGDWDSVPDSDTIDLYQGRGCTIFDTRHVSRGEAVVVSFD